MSITPELLQEFHSLGIAAIPILWDDENRKELALPKHGDIKGGIPDLDFITHWLNELKHANGLAIKLFPPFGMFDFDMKNTDNKDVYKDWFNIINATNPDIFRKVCIETTRSGGYHVYIKYAKLQTKTSVALSKDDREVIAVYTGGLLSYAAPTKGYEIVHNDFADIQELTDDEFDLLVSTAAMFHESKSYKSGESKIKLTTYPTEYENTCLQFDYTCTDEMFETLLNSIDLFRVNDNKFKRKSFIPFLRKGSEAVYSAKAYFNYKVEHEGKVVANSHRLLIFSGSMTKYPTWQDSSKMEDTSWSLSPAKIVFYKNNQDWVKTIEEINCILESAGFEIPMTQPVTRQPLQTPDRLKFPYDIFPQVLQNYIFAHRIQHEYIGNFLLSAVSSALGNSVTLQASNSYKVKPVIYMAVVAPSGGGKSPAMKVAFRAVDEMNIKLYMTYKDLKKEYNQLKSNHDKDKKANKLPEEPILSQILIKDSTIEMVIKILSDNPSGCVIYADELSGFIKRIDQYKQGDEVQKWLELWSGGSVLMQRISRESNLVKDPFCNIVGGIQMGLLGMFSNGENEYNGFYQRFVFAYPEPESKNDWGVYDVPQSVINDYYEIFGNYFYVREACTQPYILTPEANTLYGEWFNYKNKKYNQATSDHIKGIITKYQDYCLRFAALIQAMNDHYPRDYKVTEISMERAIRLTEYYLGMMNKVTKLLTPESPIDKLIKPYSDIHNELPEIFTTKTAIDISAKYNIKDKAIKAWIARNTSGKTAIFRQLGRGEYEKIYS